MNLIRKAIFAAVIVTAFSVPASADELTDGAKAQLALSDQLISLGRERKDAILILAGAHLRDNLTNDPIADVGTVPDKDVLLGEAKAFAGDREDLVSLADDIQEASSRGC